MPVYDDWLTPPACPLPVYDDGLTVLYPDLLTHVGGHAVPVTVLLQR